MHFFQHTAPKIVMQCRPCAFAVDADAHGRCHIVAHASMNGVQQLVHSAPLVFSAKKSAGGISRGYAQNEAQMDHPQIIS